MFKADICLMTEYYVNNDPKEGCDPSTSDDHGVIQTITRNSIEGLKKELHRAHKMSEYEQFENRLEFVCEEIDTDGVRHWSCYSIDVSEVVHA